MDIWPTEFIGVPNGNLKIIYYVVFFATWYGSHCSITSPTLERYVSKPNIG